MSLQSWLQNSWLVRHTTSPEEIANLLALSDRELAACQVKQLPADWRFAIAYNAGGAMRFPCTRLRLCVLCFAILCNGSSHDIVAQQNVHGNLFDFHSGFWINLHHFLYRQAQLSTPQNGPHNLALTKADTDELQQLSAGERDRWNETLSYYSRFVVKRDLLFDDELIQTKDALEDAETSSDLR